MIKVVPTITAVTPADYAREIAGLDFALRLHVDITDGDFAPSRTVNLNQVYWDSDKIINLHLMLRRPSEWLHQIVALKPNLVILHAESEGDLLALAEHLHKFGIRVGVALLPETSVASARDLIEIADHVLIFGGHLGYQGGSADLTQLGKVAQIKKINPRAEIGWDGGANAGNVAEIAAAGIDVINVGSAISKAQSPREAYQTLKNLAN
jgi:ribulose-phosphate 3-epimerase